MSTSMVGPSHHVARNATRIIVKFNYKGNVKSVKFGKTITECVFVKPPIHIIVTKYPL